MGTTQLLPFVGALPERPLRGSSFSGSALGLLKCSRHGASVSWAALLLPGFGAPPKLAQVSVPQLPICASVLMISIPYAMGICS